MSDTAASLNADGTLATDPTFARLDYALTDRNFSVIGTGFTSGEIGDRVRYDPYGTFQAFPAGDVNRDGAVNSGDTTAIMFASGYQADLDVNIDGAVDSKDSGVVSKLRGRSLGAGELSDRGNIVGWCGYLYEEATGMWLARHRWQIPELGRWANRDPIGYAGGGQNLYEYVNGNPVVLQDPSGRIGGFFDMIGEGFQQAKSDIGNWLFDTDIEEVHEQQTDNHYNICDNFRKRLGMGRDMECQTEEEWEEQKANLHAAYANNGCDGPPVLTDFGEIALDALKESAHGFITGDPEHWNEVQDYLDWVGMAPGVGIIADGMNLAISLVRGNWSRALWSASAMVPGWGNASQGTRYAMNVGKVPKFTKIPQSHTAGRKFFWGLFGPGGKAPRRLVRVRDRKNNYTYLREEVMELHHITPQRRRGPHTPGNYRPGWPNDHERWDKHRHTGYDVIEVLEYYY